MSLGVFIVYIFRTVLDSAARLLYFNANFSVHASGLDRSNMGSSSSKVGGTTDVGQPQHGVHVIHAPTATASKRPRSPSSDQLPHANGQPQLKRSRNEDGDDHVEEVRQNLERRFEALRTQPNVTAAPNDAASIAAATDYAAAGEPPDVVDGSASPASSVTSIGDDVADIAVGGRHDANYTQGRTGDTAVRTTSPSPELRPKPGAVVDSFGWSVRHLSNDPVGLASTLLRTTDFPDYAAAFRASVQHHLRDNPLAPDRRRRTVEGIQRANIALRDIDIESTVFQETSLRRFTSRVTESGRQYPLHEPKLAKVASAFKDDFSKLRDTCIKDLAQVAAPLSAPTTPNSQRRLIGLWHKDGSKAAPDAHLAEIWSVNKRSGWQTEWERPRFKRIRQRTR